MSVSLSVHPVHIEQHFRQHFLFLAFAKTKKPSGKNHQPTQRGSGGASEASGAHPARIAQAVTSPGHRPLLLLSHRHTSINYVISGNGGVDSQGKSPSGLFEPIGRGRQLGSVPSPTPNRELMATRIVLWVRTSPIGHGMQ